jgi:hypothetical protein
VNDDNYIEELAAKIRAQVDPADLPADGLDQLFASYALLALSKGVEVSNEDVHDAWSVWATQFDPDSKSLVPFDELSTETQAQDTVYREAIRDAAKTLSD